MTKWVKVCFLCLLLANCGIFRGKTDDSQMPEIPDALRKKSAINETIIEGEDEGKLAPEIRVALQEHAQKQLEWTDPDDFFGDVSKIRKLIAAPKREIWQKTEAQARKSAMREGKCLMIWFTDTKRSPVCKTLNTELFSQTAFGDWAKEHLIRLMVDQSSLISTGMKVDGQVIAANQVQAMKTKYKVQGSPTIIMISPRGEQLAKYRGYKKGTSQTLWGQLKYSVGIGNAEYQSWLKSLEKQGYRLWRDQNQRQVVAKLVHYHQGVLNLVEPDGERLKTRELSLCSEDRAWIAAEKKKRGL